MFVYSEHDEHKDLGNRSIITLIYFQINFVFYCQQFSWNRKINELINTGKRENQTDYQKEKSIFKKKSKGKKHKEEGFCRFFKQWKPKLM